VKCTNRTLGVRLRKSYDLQVVSLVTSVTLPPLCVALTCVT